MSERYFLVRSRWCYDSSDYFVGFIRESRLAISPRYVYGPSSKTVIRSGKQFLQGRRVASEWAWRVMSSRRGSHKRWTRAMLAQKRDHEVCSLRRLAVNLKARSPRRAYGKGRFSSASRLQRIHRQEPKLHGMVSMGAKISSTRRNRISHLSHANWYEMRSESWVLRREDQSRCYFRAGGCITSRSERSGKLGLFCSDDA